VARFSSEGVDELPVEGEEVRYAISLVRQGEHRFYTLTMPSSVLAACAYATSKDEDPVAGFQRVLDEGRAQEIADYIDSGGTIPSSVVLSAQPDSGFKSVDRSKTAAFKFGRYSFLIIDGQHRVFGFAKAKTAFRVPVVIYDNLTKDQEAKLFIDINTKQRPVPKELLLAIKSLANSESDIEARLAQIFDLFDAHPKSALIGYTSSNKKAAGKIDRVTFNAGLRPHLASFDGREASYIFDVWNAYFHAITHGLRQKDVANSIGKKTTFRAFCELFPDIVQRVQDKFGGRYTADNFATVTKPIFALKSTFFTKPPSSILETADAMKRVMRSNLTV
jgi:DGQHR domain-containing protein